MGNSIFVSGNASFRDTFDDGEPICATSNIMANNALEKSISFNQTFAKFQFED